MNDPIDPIGRKSPIDQNICCGLKCHSNRNANPIDAADANVMKFANAQWDEMHHGGLKCHGGILCTMGV